MKLLYCIECLDLFSLRRELRECGCRQSAGFYERDDITVRVCGPCVCVGIDSADLERAIRNDRSKGREIRSFLIGSGAERIVRQSMAELKHAAWSGRRSVLQ